MSNIFKELFGNDPLYNEELSFAKLKEEGKLEQYLGKFIAIYKGKIVGVNDNIGNLQLNVYKKYGYEWILMRKVEPDKNIIDIDICAVSA